MKRTVFGKQTPGKKDAVFLAIYVEEIAPWKYFKDQILDVKCPAVIMIDRWDGRMGFPGGTLNENEPIKEALVREIKEEVGITVKPEKLRQIASNQCLTQIGRVIARPKSLHAKIIRNAPPR